MTKIKADREILAERLKKAYKFVPQNSVIPAMLNFKISVTGNSMEIVAGDSQCSVKIYCSVKSDGDISFCVPAQIFYRTIDKFRENDVIITVKDDKIELKNGKAKYKVSSDCLASDYPVMPQGKMDSEFSILQYNLKMGIKFSNKFIDEERSKMVNANGINIDEINSRIVFTGLDGFNACRANVAPMGVGSWCGNFVLPEDSADKISSMLSDNGEVTVCHGDGKMILFTEGDNKFEITTLSVNTKFPNSENIFSKRGDTKMIINTNEFRDAVNRLRLYASDDDSDKRVIVKTSDENVNELILTSVDSNRNKSGEECITIDNPSGKPMNKGFNSISIINVLNCIDENEFCLYFTDDNRIPVFIHPNNKEGIVNSLDFLIGTVSTN